MRDKRLPIPGQTHSTILRQEPIGVGNMTMILSQLTERGIIKNLKIKFTIKQCRDHVFMTLLKKEVSRIDGANTSKRNENYRRIH